MAKKLKLGDRWRHDRMKHVGYPAAPALEAIMQLSYYLGARAALASLAHGDRDKGVAALRKEITQFLLAAGLHE
jgi:hypothetical protein